MDAELLITAAAVLVTLTAGLLFASEAAAIVRDHLVAGRWLHSLEPVLFTLLVGTLVYGSLVYQLARLGYFHRLKLHRPASPADLETLRSPAARPSLTVLVPAYKEDPRVVRKTLLSAALLDYPGRRVVLLIDNPPEPTGPRDADELRETRGLPGDVAALLAEPRTALRDIADGFEQRAATGFDAARETAALAAAHAEAGDWLLKQTAAYPVADHTDEFFVQLTFCDPARRHRERSEELLRGGALPTPEAIRAEYRRLVDRFAVTLTSFERKRYANLSHEPRPWKVGDPADVRVAVEQAVQEELAALLGAGRFERCARRIGYRNGHQLRTPTGPTGPLGLTLPRALVFTPRGPKEWVSTVTCGEVAVESLADARCLR